MILTKTTKDWEKTIYKYLPEKIDNFHIGMDRLADYVFSDCGLDEDINGIEKLEDFLEDKWRSGNACESVGGYGYDFCVFEFEWGDEDLVAFMASSGDYFRGVHVWMICDECYQYNVVDKIMEKGRTNEFDGDLMISRDPLMEMGCFDIYHEEKGIDISGVYIDSCMCEEDHYEVFWDKVRVIVKKEEKRLEEINARKNNTTERN